MGNEERVIRCEIEVNAGVGAVWDAWTTEAGIKTFFAPACHVELRPDGPYEILFNPHAEPGRRGSEGTHVLGYQPWKMLSFTWIAPPELPVARQQRTHVTVRMQGLSNGHTRVSLVHDGWGEGGEWDYAYEYFVEAWGKIVLPRLKHRFDAGPIDWEHPPKF